MPLRGGTKPFSVSCSGLQRCGKGGGGDPVLGPPRGAGSLPRPTLPSALLPRQKFPSWLLFLNYPLSSQEPAGKQGRGGPGASEVLRAAHPPLFSPAKEAPCQDTPLGKPLLSHLAFPARRRNFFSEPGSRAAVAGAEGRAWPSSSPVCGRPVSAPGRAEVALETFSRLCAGGFMLPALS